MEIVVLSKEEYQQLILKLDSLSSKLEGQIKDSRLMIIDNEEFLNLMNVSKRTAQTWRDEGKISFSQIENKIYYTMYDVQEF